MDQGNVGKAGNQSWCAGIYCVWGEKHATSKDKGGHLEREWMNVCSGVKPRRDSTEIYESDYLIKVGDKLTNDFLLTGGGLICRIHPEWIVMLKCLWTLKKH